MAEAYEGGEGTAEALVDGGATAAARNDAGRRGIAMFLCLSIAICEMFYIDQHT